MTSTDKNARAAWATLTHDSLNNGHVGKHTLTGVQFFFLNFGLLLGNILVLFNTGAFASVSPARHRRSGRQPQSRQLDADLLFH